MIAVLWALVLLALIAAPVLGESRSVSRLARDLAAAVKPAHRAFQRARCGAH